MPVQQCMKSPCVSAARTIEPGHLVEHAFRQKNTVPWITEIGHWQKDRRRDSGAGNPDLFSGAQQEGY